MNHFCKVTIRPTHFSESSSLVYLALDISHVFLLSGAFLTTAHLWFFPPQLLSSSSLP
jgi:hypothetical protein